MTNKRRGFSLVELLVVIAIIAILAGLLFAAMSRVRENGRKTNCASNMKQLFVAVQLYMQPYDETMPLAYADFDPANNTFDPSAGEKGWAEALQPFIKSTQVFGCPSDPDGVVDDPAGAYTTYAYNAALGYQPSGIGPRTLADIKSDELTILFIETPPGDSSNSRPGALNQTGLLTGANALSNTKLARHLGGSNLVFCDGHVKFYPAVSDTESSKIYTANTKFNVSGDSPTFHADDTISYP